MARITNQLSSNPYSSPRKEVAEKFSHCFDLVINLQKELGLQENRVVLAGGALRDIRADLEPKDYDIFILNIHPIQFSFIKTLLNKIYFNLGQPAPPPNAPTQLDPYSFDGHYRFTSAGYFNVDGYICNLVLTQATNALPLIESFDFNVNAIAIDAEALIYNAKIHGEHLANKRLKILNRERVNFETVEYFTQKANYLEQRLGFILTDDDKEHLDKWDLNKLKKRTGPKIGYRAFGLAPSAISSNEFRLSSPMKHTIWNSKSMDAECGGSKSMALTHLRNQECMCGINMYNSALESDYANHPVVAEMEGYGLIRELEKGSRVETGVIKQLWVVEDNISPVYTDKFSEVHPTRLKLCDKLQEFYGVPVHQAKLKNVAHIISARSGVINLEDPNGKSR